MNQVLIWLQSYNVRHEFTYHGMATVQFCDDGSGALWFGEELIAQLDFSNMDSVKDYLLNQ